MSNSSKAFSLRCEPIEDLHGLQCLGLHADDVALTEEACREHCCEDLACEVWQFNPRLVGTTCFRGRPHLCTWTSSLFVFGSVGARIRGEVLSDARINLGDFNVLETIDPFADIGATPESHRIIDVNGDAFMVRRTRGPGLYDLDVLIPCWGRTRSPERCCNDPHLATCFPKQRYSDLCCPVGGLADPDMVFLVSEDFSEADRQFWDSLIPKTVWNEDDFERKKRRWRVGAHPASQLCPAMNVQTGQSLVRSGREEPSGLRGFIRTFSANGIRLGRTFVNIGAGDCQPPDPLHDLLHSSDGSGFVGLAIDAEAKNVALCRQYTKNATAQYEPVHLVAEPTNIIANILPYLAILAESHKNEFRGKQPWPLDVLVVDIDGADCLVTEELLQILRPKLLLIEIAFHIPPPFEFSAQYDADRSSLWQEDYNVEKLNPVTGCSLSYAVRRLAGFGMNLLRLTDNDALFVHVEASSIIQQNYGIKLPQDEFECYRRSRLWLQAPPEYVREWFFAPHPADVLGRVWSNITWMNRELGRPDAPFSLSY